MMQIAIGLVALKVISKAQRAQAHRVRCAEEKDTFPAFRRAGLRSEMG
jgi:hypothetical protein